MTDPFYADYDAVFIWHREGELTWFIGYEVTATGHRFFDGTAYSRRGAQRVARRFQQKIVDARLEKERRAKLPVPETVVYRLGEEVGDGRA